MDPLDAVNKIFPKEPVPRSGSSKVAGLRPEADAELTDAVDFNSDSLVDAVRVQAGLLQNELPGIISEMLLAPAAG